MPFIGKEGYIRLAFCGSHRLNDLIALPDFDTWVVCSLPDQEGLYNPMHLKRGERSVRNASLSPMRLVEKGLNGFPIRGNTAEEGIEVTGARQYPPHRQTRPG